MQYLMCAVLLVLRSADAKRIKVRATWGYPLHYYLAEAGFFHPILEHFKSIQAPTIAYGIEIANGGMKWLDEKMGRHPTETFLMGDWSRFDKTIPPWLIRDAFNILWDWIDDTHVIDSDDHIWGIVNKKLAIIRTHEYSSLANKSCAFFSTHNSMCE